MNSINKVLIALFFALAATTSPVFDIPIERVHAGFRATGIMYNIYQPIPVFMYLHFGPSSVLSRAFEGYPIIFGCRVPGPGLRLEVRNGTYQPDRRRDLLGIGPGSHMLELHNSIDFVQVADGDLLYSLKFGQSLDEFESSSCANGTMFDAPVASDVFPHTVMGRFDLVDPISRAYYNASSIGDIQLQPSVGGGSSVTIPHHLATQIHDILSANNARRIVSNITPTISSWAYEGCSPELLARLPLLALDFYEPSPEGPVRKGSFTFGPDEYMHHCEIEVNDSSAGTYAVDLFQIPDINLRVNRDRIYLCDSNTA